MAWINMLKSLYPVGAIYISTVSVSPASLIGGTWSSITAAVIRGVTPEESVGYIGSDSHILTVPELPIHSHQVNTSVNGTKKPYSANAVTHDGYTWTNVFTGYDTYADTSTAVGSNVDMAARTGGDEPHTNVQRSYNCYIWYRTA